MRREIRRSVRTLIFLALLLLSVSKALALGIGSDDSKLVYTPSTARSLNFYLINDEHKDTTVDISVIGALQNFVTAPQTVRLDASDSIKKFTVTVNFPSEIYAGDTKIIATEESAGSGEISAKVNLVIKIPITYPVQSNAVQTAEQADQVQQINDVTNNSVPAKTQQPTAEVAQAINIPSLTKQASQQNSSVQAPSEIWSGVINPDSTLKILILVLAAAAIIITLATFRRSASPTKQKADDGLVNFVSESLKAGERAEKIRSRLYEVGWSKERVEDAFRELNKK